MSKEPWVFSIPDMGDRYYIMPMLDGWSEVFNVAGSHTTGGKAQTYAITGPGWSGTLPQGVTEVKSPTGMVWILGRIYTTGTPEDYKAVHALQDKFSVVPLSAYGKPYTPPPGVVDPSFDMKTAVRKQVNALDIDHLFQPPRGVDEDQPADRAGCADRRADGQDRTWSRGRTSTRASSPFSDREVIKTVPEARARGNGSAPEEAEDHQRLAVLHQGRRQFRHRLSAARHGQPAWPRLEPPAGRRVPALAKGRERRRLRRRKHKYVIRFEKGQLPPAEAFWSLTMYDTDFFFVPNPINRYDLAQRDHLITNPDGSVDLYIQAESPGKDKEANWLPAPKGKFTLVLRLYSPTTDAPSILDGTWTPPPVKRLP